MQVEITGQTVVLDNIVTVDELKAYMRVTHTAEDTLITALRLAAIAYIEEHCNIKLGTYDMRGYTDLITQPSRIAFRDYPNVYEYALTPVVITFSAGYTTVPQPVVHAIKLLVSTMYENRQEEVTGTITTRLKFGLDALLNPFRIIYQP